MSSYQTRPGYGQQQPYGSGYESIPRAPRTPHFPEPSARGHQYNQTGPYAPHGYAGAQPSNRGHVPPAPHSLAPVAMASARGAAATGPQAIIQTMDTGPSRPSSKAGMSILLAGAIIGGLIGAVMHAREKAFEALEHQDKHEVVVAASSNSAPPIAMALPFGSSSSVPSNVLSGKPDPTGKDVAKDAKDVKDAKKDDAKKDDAKKKKFAWVAPKASGPKAAAAASPTESGDDAQPETTKKTKKGAKDKDDDGYTVASAGGGGDDIPSKPEKVATADKADKKGSAKADKSDKADAKPSKPKGGGDDAVNVLKAAMGATENTL